MRQASPNHADVIYPERDSHDLFLYLRGCELFNQREFYEAHHHWEDLWLRNRSAMRPLLQGLIQLAAAYYHIERANYTGLVALLAAARNRLEPFSPSMLGLAIVPLLQAVAHSQEYARTLSAADIKTFDARKLARIEYAIPTLEEFRPHAGEVVGPGFKRDWLWWAVNQDRAQPRLF
jgi:predicted metal-dependent hydrolase